MAIKYTNLFNYNTLPNLPKLGILVWKYTIWQPWFLPVLSYLISPQQRVLPSQTIYQQSNRIVFLLPCHQIFKRTYDWNNYKPKFTVNLRSVNCTQVCKRYRVLSLFNMFITFKTHNWNTNKESWTPHRPRAIFLLLRMYM
jgi:hypothetical protein